MTPFQHMCDTILFLDIDEMINLQTQRISSIRSLGNMSPASLTSMIFVDAIANMLLKIQVYIVYHDFKTDDSTWLDFDEDVWSQLPHATYAPIVVQLSTPIVAAPGSITASPRFPSAAAALHHLMPGATRHCKFGLNDC